jgi:hypothetical protein
MEIPRKGHLFDVFRVFVYLKQKHKPRMIYDPTYPKMDYSKFRANEEWEKLYGDIKEAIPSNAPQRRRKPLVLRIYVDSDHAGDQLTIRSRKGFIQMVNMATNSWHSKKQGSLEGATFGIEIVAMKTAVEANRALRYKLRMMGVPTDRATYMNCDNMSVVNNTTSTESMLKNKWNWIANHAVCKAVAL